MVKTKNNDFFKLNKLTQKILWSNEQKQYIIDEYQNGKSVTNLANEFKVSNPSISKVLEQNNIKLCHNNRKYNRNSYFFKTIDTEEKAYWLGFLYADGVIMYSKQKKGVRINLQACDEVHLKKFKKALNAEHPIKDTNKKTMNKIYEGKFISIVDYQLAEDLINLGCFPNKSLILTFPTEKQVPKNLLSHFIRGYYDGDGCIKTIKSSRQRKDGTYGISYSIHFLGTLDMITHIKEILKVQHLKTIECKNKNVFYKVEITGNKQVYKILKDFIYKDATVYLDRKYEKFLELEKYNHNNAR